MPYHLVHPGAGHLTHALMTTLSQLARCLDQARGKSTRQSGHTAMQLSCRDSTAMFFFSCGGPGFCACYRQCCQPIENRGKDCYKDDSRVQYQVPACYATHDQRPERCRGEHPGHSLQLR